MNSKEREIRVALAGIASPPPLVFIPTTKKDSLPEFIDHSLLASEEYIGNQIPLTSSFIIDLIENTDNRNAQYCDTGDVGCYQTQHNQPHSSVLQYASHFTNKKKTFGDEILANKVHILESIGTVKDDLDSNFLSIEDFNDGHFKIFQSSEYGQIPNEEIQISLMAPPSLQAPRKLYPPKPRCNSEIDCKLAKDDSIFLSDSNEIWASPSVDKPSLHFEDIQNTLPTKRILPHKKRITNKLKTSCPIDGSSNMGTDNIVLGAVPFICQICGLYSDSQIDFFAHLKGHYEPTSHHTQAELLNNVKIFDGINAPVSPTSSLINHSENFKSTDDVNNDTLSFSKHQFDEDCKPCLAIIEESEKQAQSAKLNTSEHEIDFSDNSVDMMEGVRGLIEKAQEQIDTFDIAEEQTNEQQIENKTLVGHDDFHEQVFRCDPIVNNFYISSYDSEIRGPPPSPPVLRKPAAAATTNRLFNSKTIMSKKRHKKKLPPNNISNDSNDCDIELMNKKSQYVCKKCHKEFNSCNALKYHLLSHTGERPHQCDICGKSFFAGSALKAHLRVHSGDKPYECEECNRKFRQWGDLKYHITSIHTDEKNYQCEFCGKSFSRKYSLVVHRRIHTKERNYACEFCSKAFRASSYLQNHRKIHTGEKPYECEICHKKFRVRGDLGRHKKTHDRNVKLLEHIKKISPIKISKVGIATSI